ncbi:MAG: hypothetical protein U0K91_10505 [Acutalibacteraceae bacterium]|nr:hypothetical protein [Acutalibacteraceae bacterium]
MNTDKLVRKSLLGLSKSIIFSMPEKNFTTSEKANKYMLKGDNKFSTQKGEHFTCGFGKSVLTPDDIKIRKYFIAGYDSNNPAQGVLDDMFARAVYIDDNTGRGGVVICSVDAVGISRKDINKIRKLVIESGKIPSLKSINICATHSHSAIDTQGLWGEKLFSCGRDEDFMKRLRKLTAEAIIKAYENRADGKMFYSVKKTEELQYDCRTPDTYDSNLTKIRFESFDGKKNIHIINFASHAELLGSCTKNVSADFPAYMIKKIEANNENCDAVFINGAIGGMISAKEIKKVYRETIDCEAYTKEFGKNLGEIANSLTDETELAPLINVKSAPVSISASNYVLILARFLGVLNNDISRERNKGVASIYSEVGYLELGEKEIGMFLIPGELFPELFNGEFLSEKESANGKKANYNILSEQGSAKHKFVVGLCNDELGYIIPDNDFFLDSKLPYINGGHDKFDRNHYEETNTTGPETARTLLEATEKIIKSIE